MFKGGVADEDWGVGGPPGLGLSPDGLLWVSRLPSLWDGECFK